jgi:glycosyltransferase involved in cell wall biosynthesis
MRVLAWGTYDTGKPRVRLLLEGLRRQGVSVSECHTDVWSGIEDKSGIEGIWKTLRIGLRWLLAYPGLVVRFCLAPKPDVVLVGYLGQLDVLVLWPFAKLRRVPVVWDAFVLMYNTVVEDRAIFGRGHPAAKLVLFWEWLACRACDLVLMDTRAHADYVADRFSVERARVADVPVGAEDVFHAAASRTSAVPRGPDEEVDVFFYGQFIPLHGIETLLAAARIAEHEAIRWTIVGRGQEEGRIRALLDAYPLAKVEWIPWLPYAELAGRIVEADVCLGIFGESDKAARVIPNKVYQVLAAGAPLVTRDSPAMRELVPAGESRVMLVPPADPEALVSAIRALVREARAGRLPAAGPALRIGADEVGQRFRAVLVRLLSSKPRLDHETAGESGGGGESASKDIGAS